MEAHGYVQVYTGAGKGKTTAALGLALRALGAGKRVYFGQFMKHDGTGEALALRSFANACMEQYGTGTELCAPDAQADRAAAQAGYARALAALASGTYDVVVLDEANVAAHMGYLTPAQLDALLSQRPAAVELIFTGRFAPQQLLDAADLVTEMREIKHYFHAGVPARRGIEF